MSMNIGASINKVRNDGLTLPKTIICVLACMGPLPFFVLSSFLGYTYGGSDVSNVYIIYNVAIAILSYMVFVFQGQKKRFSITLLLPFIVCSSYILSKMIGSAGNVADYFFQCFLIWSLPAFIIGLFLTQRGYFNTFVKVLDFVMIIITIYALINAIQYIEHGWSVFSVSGTTYQEVSYAGAFAYGLNLYLIINGRYIDRFNIFNRRIYAFISYISIIVQVGVVILGGGRGALLTVIAYTILYLIPLLFKKHKLGIILGILAIAIVCAFIIHVSADNPTLQHGLNRLLNNIFTNNGTINWEASKERYLLYSKATTLILDKPFLGYGLFGQYEVLGKNVHNIFLEILVGSGIIGFIILIYFMYLVIKRYLVLRKFGVVYKSLSVFLVFSFINLMFSGTWIVSTYLWFSVALILSIDIIDLQKQTIKTRQPINRIYLRYPYNIVM